MLKSEKGFQNIDDVCFQEGLITYSDELCIVNAVRQGLTELFESLDRDNVVFSHQEEGGVGYVDSLFPKANVLISLNRAQYDKEIVKVFNAIRKRIIAHIGRVIDAGVSLFSIKELDLFDMPDGFGIEYHNVIDSRVISIDGPQGSGKSTQVKKLKQELIARGINVAEGLPKQEDPAHHIVEYENSNSVIMPFFIRQRYARSSLEARYIYGVNSRQYAVLDRSLFTPFNFHSTISYIHDVEADQMRKDANELNAWWQIWSSNYESNTIALMNKNVVRGFFRMKRDQDVGNQRADFVSQVLEHIFYQHLINIGFAQKIEVAEKNVDQVSNIIIQNVCQE